MSRTGPQLAGDRFEVGARLGHGDMGMVFEAWDRTASRAVALKVYRHGDDVTVDRVRRIFERLRGMRHRNVVQLLELIEGGDAPVLVMERVDGEDMMSYVRPVRCELARLRSCLVQMVAGLSELHRRDVIHRDLKPSNLRVTPEGRLVILDFSLSDDRGADGEAGGSIAYMAPEQAMIDAAVGPAADWYALGAITYEALSGKPPFTGKPQRVLQDKAAHEPPPIEKVVPNAPRDLAELCRRLLVPDAQRRPVDTELRAMVGLAPPTRPATSDAPPPRRQVRAAARVMERLRRAADEGRAGLVAVSGEHGIGRSSLLHAIGEQIRATWQDALVLSLRATATMEGDFLDDLGHQLAAAWTTLPAEEQAAIVPRQADALVELLPAIGIVPAIARLPARERRTAGHVALTEAIDALRELLTLLSRRRPVAILIDDLDDIDPDGARVLADGLRGPDPPPVLLVASCADESRLPAIEHLVPVPLEWWSRTEIERLLDERTLSAETVRAIVERCEGNPALAVELAKSSLLGEIPPEGGLIELFVARIDRLAASTCELLAASSLVPGGVPMATLVRALDLDRGAVDPLLAVLSTASLIAPRDASDVVAPASPSVRQALAARIDDQTVARLARALALHADELPPSLQAQLWSLTGDAPRTAAAAEVAGERARDRMRHAAATDAYRLAVAAGRHDLFLELAECAAAAGLGGEAARAFIEAAHRMEGAEQLRLAVRAAEHLVLAGELDAGVDCFRDALRLAGIHLAASPARAIPSLLLRRGWLRVRGIRFTARPRTELPPFDLARADACFSAGYHLGVLENVIGAELQSRALSFALRLGEPERLGYSAVLEAIFLCTQGALKRAERLLALAQQRAEQLGSARLTTFIQLGIGAVDFFHRNRFAGVVRMFEAIAATPDTEPWTLEMARSYGCIALSYLGDVHELTRRVLTFIREAERRGDHYAATIYRVRLNLVWLARGDAHGADEALATAARQWPFDTTRFRVPDYYWMYARTERALWGGDVAGAAALLAAGVPPLEKSMLTRVHHVRSEVDFLAGRVGLAAAEVGSAGDAVAPFVRRLRKNPVGQAPGLAALLAGCAALRDGDAAGAAPLLVEAVARTDDLELGLHAAAARVRLGEALGGGEGAASSERGYHDLARLGVTESAKTIHLFAPR